MIGLGSSSAGDGASPDRPQRRRWASLSAAVEDSRFSSENGGFVSWEEMVLLAYLLWTNGQIHRALGDQAAQVFPPLAHLVALTIRIPRHKAIALRSQARRRHLDVSELVADDVSVFRDEAERLERRAPGYMEAWHFPYGADRRAHSSRRDGQKPKKRRASRARLSEDGETRD